MAKRTMWDLSEAAERRVVNEVARLQDEENRDYLTLVDDVVGCLRIEGSHNVWSHLREMVRGDVMPDPWKALIADQMIGRYRDRAVAISNYLRVMESLRDLEGDDGDA